jgi:hypothetical protein
VAFLGGTAGILLGSTAVALLSRATSALLSRAASAFLGCGRSAFLSCTAVTLLSCTAVTLLSRSVSTLLGASVTDNALLAWALNGVRFLAYGRRRHFPLSWFLKCDGLLFRGHGRRFLFWRLVTCGKRQFAERSDA